MQSNHHTLQLFLALALILFKVSAVTASESDLREIYCSQLHEQSLVSKSKLDIAAKSQQIKQALIQYVADSDINHSTAQQLIKRINSIQVHLKYCQANGVSYNPITNKVSGCIRPAQTAPILTKFIIAHELAHSIDMCSFHVGVSDFSYHPLNWGKKLRYSNPDNFESSLKEYPFSKIIENQPEAIKNFSLNLIDSQGIPKVCQRKKSDELFADFIAFKILNGRQFHTSQIDTILREFCPTKIPVKTIRLNLNTLNKDEENQSHVVPIYEKEKLEWSDSHNSLHLDFNSRASQLLHLWSTNSPNRNPSSATGLFKSCLAGVSRIYEYAKLPYRPGREAVLNQRKYQIEKFLGHGSAFVFQAKDIKANRLVTIKFDMQEHLWLEKYHQFEMLLIKYLREMGIETEEFLDFGKTEKGLFYVVKPFVVGRSAEDISDPVLLSELAEYIK